MIKIAWENKGTSNGLACHENVKTSSNRIGKAHTTIPATHPPTHTDTLSFVSIFLSTLLAYSSALSIPLSLIPLSHIYSKAAWLHMAPLEEAWFCPCATVLKAQQNNEVDKWQINVCVN